MKKGRKRILFKIFLVLAAVLGVIIYSGNNTLVTTEISVESDDIPNEFDGFRIVQVSDLHNTSIGENHEKLMNEIKAAEPNIIVITGDIIDCRKTDVECAVNFAEKAAAEAPCYFVPGNHEAQDVSLYRELVLLLEEAGVTVLENESVFIENNGSRICIAGLEDPLFYSSVSREERLLSIVDSSCFTVLLSHRPELFSEYVNAGADLVFAGHAHGGQFRIPGIGGIYAPGQGLFPEFSKGTYSEGGTVMAVSRGIGNSAFPFRLNNKPEIIAVTLHAK